MKWLVWSALALTAVFITVWIIGALLPKSHSVSRTLELRQSPETIWAVITGPPTWRSDIKSYQNLPPQNGHRMWRESDSHANTITYEETESRVLPGPPPVWRRVTRIADPNLPFGGTWTFEVTPVPEGSRLTITEHGEVYNPFFRFASRFIFGHTATIDAYMKALNIKLS